MIITFEAILLDYISSTFVFEIILSQSAFAILYRSFFSWRDFRFEISFLKHFILHFQHSDVKVVIFLELSPNIAPTFFLKLPSLENYILLKSKLVKQAILGQKQICNNQPDCLNTQYLRTTVSKMVRVWETFSNGSGTWNSEFCVVPGIRQKKNCSQAKHLQIFLFQFQNSSNNEEKSLNILQSVNANLGLIASCNTIRNK